MMALTQVTATLATTLQEVKQDVARLAKGSEQPTNRTQRPRGAAPMMVLGGETQPPTKRGRKTTAVTQGGYQRFSKPIKAPVVHRPPPLPAVPEQHELTPATRKLSIEDRMRIALASPMTAVELATALGESERSTRAKLAELATKGAVYCFGPEREDRWVWRIGEVDNATLYAALKRWITALPLTREDLVRGTGVTSDNKHRWRNVVDAQIVEIRRHEPVYDYRKPTRDPGSTRPGGLFWIRADGKAPPAEFDARLPKRERPKLSSEALAARAQDNELRKQLRAQKRTAEQALRKLSRAQR